VHTVNDDSCVGPLGGGFGGEVRGAALDAHHMLQKHELWCTVRSRACTGNHKFMRYARILKIRAPPPPSYLVEVKYAGVVFEEFHEECRAALGVVDAIQGLHHRDHAD
jgi:hypothetical protein